MILTTDQLKSLKTKGVSKDKEKSKERIKTDFQKATPIQKRAMCEVSGLSKAAFYRTCETGSPSAKIVLAMASELNVSPFYYSGEANDKEPCTDELIIQFLEANDYNDITKALKRKITSKEKREAKKSADKAKEISVTTTVENDIPTLKANIPTIADEAAETTPVNDADTTAPASKDVKTPKPKTKTKKIPEYNPMTDEEIEAATAHDYALCKASMAEEAIIRPVPELSEDEAVLLLRAMFVRVKAGGSTFDLDAVKRLLMS